MTTSTHVRMALFSLPEGLFKIGWLLTYIIVYYDQIHDHNIDQISNAGVLVDG